MNTITEYARIVTEAAELARQFWLEIEVEFTRQAEQCQAGSPAQMGISGHSRPRGDKPLRSTKPAEALRIDNEH